MNDNFNHQKEALVSIEHEIKLLQQQVRYLLRNEQALGLLDLDVLMNRTHTLYDKLCSIQLGADEGEEDLDIDPEALAGFFGGQAQEEKAEEVSPDEVVEPLEPEPIEPEKEPTVETEPVMEEEVVENEEPENDVAAMWDAPTVKEEVPEEPIQEPEPVVEPEPEPTEQPTSDGGLHSDPFGFVFRFEDEPEEEAVVEDRVEETEDGRIVHFMKEISEDDIPERDRIDGEHLQRDNPLVMPTMDDEMPQQEAKQVQQELFPIVEEEPAPQAEEEHPSPAEQAPDFNAIFDNDESGFELSSNEVLGEKMMGEDHSLAAKLGYGSAYDLKSAIGINDKFLFVNELFGGSMEKFNKSIENLNDLKTLNGALIYLNELKIELQWNSNNVAYQKLADLVAKKFETK